MGIKRADLADLWAITLDDFPKFNMDRYLRYYDYICKIYEELIMEFSGKKETFDTGATREEKTGKGQPALVYPGLMTRLAKWLELGAKNHGARNWESGIPSESYLNSAYRHLLAYHTGDRGEDHLAALLFNIQGLIYNEEMIGAGRLDPALGRLPKYTKLPEGVWAEAEETDTGISDELRQIDDPALSGLYVGVPGWVANSDPVGIEKKTPPPEVGIYNAALAQAQVKMASQMILGLEVLKPDRSGDEFRIVTQSGRSFNVFDPDPDDVCLEDIAAALSKICRYTGHTKQFYSVAEHCVRAVDWSGYAYSPGCGKHILMHDAAEAYLADIASPVKKGLKEYGLLEDKVLRAIYKHFGLDTVHIDCSTIKMIDRRMYRTEVVHLMPDHKLFSDWHPEAESYAIATPWEPMTPEQAEDMFLMRAKELGIVE